MAHIQYLTSKEVADFVDCLDKDNDGCISYAELESKLDQISHDLEPDAKEHHLHHESQDEQRHEFLRQMLGTNRDTIPVDEFKKTVESWEIPSLEQDKQAAKDEDDYMKKIPLNRKIRSYWEVDGPSWIFLIFVFGWIIGLGIWQCYKYAAGPQYQAAFGWGVGMAKFCAGALYATMFFLVLSMSRWFSTFMRRWYYVSRFVNWDLFQEFHIKMSILALFLATLHAIGHLSGTFVFGSRSDRQPAVGILLGPDAIPRPYVAYIRSRPGWTGLVALGLFWCIALLSMPPIRRRSYEIFQLGHLLMFPMLGLLMAHGTLGLLQYPILGFVLAFPTLLVFCERSLRFLHGFYHIPAQMNILDGETVEITCKVPGRYYWKYHAGQYVFLQVPQLSYFQWHPFTISTCIGRTITLHIKTDGDWTGRLRKLDNLKHIGIDGPYGAPAQRFYDFDQSIIVGAGIGVTPFSGILTDLQTREDHRWKSRRNSTTSNGSQATTAAEAMGPPKEKVSTPNGVEQAINQSQQRMEETQTEKQRKGSNFNAVAHAIEHKDTHLPSGKELDLTLYRRVDFHFIVRDKNYLLWFSDLLNHLASGNHDPHLDIRIHNHLTKKRKDLSIHVFRWLLERHRTSLQPVSPLTGLIAPTHFGRPDFPTILNKHYDEMMTLFQTDSKRRRRVGVFFCGAPIIGRQLADLCRELTARGRVDGTQVEYFFMMEVFG